MKLRELCKVFPHYLMLEINETNFTSVDEAVKFTGVTTRGMVDAIVNSAYADYSVRLVVPVTKVDFIELDENEDPIDLIVYISQE